MSTVGALQSYASKMQLKRTVLLAKAVAVNTMPDQQAVACTATIKNIRRYNAILHSVVTMLVRCAWLI